MPRHTRFKPSRAIAVAIGFTFALTTVAFANPSDPFSAGLPGRDTAPPEGNSNTGTDADVSTQQGAATYSYPIVVPPGRGGMAPHLALDYSSDGALRGGLAVGWTLSLPSIERDTRQPDAYRYQGELLIASPGDTGSGTIYRPRIERGGMARLERTPTSWIARTPDGITRVFAGDAMTRWNLASEKDAFGNTVTYNWSSVTSSDGHVDFVLTSIDYGANSNAGLSAHGRVELSWLSDNCAGATIPIGARFDGHFGIMRMFGARRLTNIKTRVRDTQGGSWRDVRSYNLTYSASELNCNSPRPPLRYITQIDEVGNPSSSTPLAMPPVKFTYGPSQRDLSNTIFGYTGALGERGTDDGPESQLMDFDGDGINDQVRAITPPAGSSEGCKLSWRKGVGNGFFLAPHESWLPSADWGGPDKTRFATSDACTLNGQFASRNTFAYGATPHCIASAEEVGYRFLDWDHDGDLDLVANVVVTGFAHADGDFLNTFEETGGEGGGQGGCPEGTTESGSVESGGTTTHYCKCPEGQHPNWDNSGCDNDEQCESGTSWSPEGNGCGADCGGFQTCNDMPLPDTFPGQLGPPGLTACSNDISPTVGFHVFFNNDGEFHSSALDSDRRYIDSPVPLPANGGGLRLVGFVASSTPGLPTLVDIDGDGALDVITLDDEPYRPGIGEQSLGAATHLNVYRGNADGVAFGAREQWPLPHWSENVPDRTMIDITGHSMTMTQAGTLTDVDGDGLPDIVVQIGPESGPGAPPFPYVHVAYNLHGAFAAPVSLGVRSPVGQQKTELSPDWDASRQFDVGWRADERVLSDIDNDGRPDLVVLGTNSAGGLSASADNLLIVHLGDGGTSGGNLSNDWEPVERLVRANNPMAWFRQTDFVDITGDGRPDSLTFNEGGTVVIRTDAFGSDPERLLLTVDNGRGAVTRFTYGFTTDPSLVASEPGKHREPRWVVRTKTANPGPGSPSQPTITTNFLYGAAVFGKELASDPVPRFLGFSSTTVDRSGQQGTASSRTVTDYSYAIDSNTTDIHGHPVHQVTYQMSGGAWSPTAVATTSWASSPITNGVVRFFHRDTQMTRSCDAGATLAQCEVEAESVLTERDAWIPLQAYAGTALYLHQDSISEQPHPGGGIDQRVTHREYQTRFGLPPYASTDYRVLPILEERRASPTGPAITRTTTTYDFASGLPTDTYEYTTTSSADASHTVRTFDTLTGNVSTIRRPNQVAAGSPKVTVLFYDAHRLFVSTTTNELGHVLKETHDFGTGALTKREGPNKRTWTTCVITCVQNTQYAPEEWSIDAFGRITAHRVAVDPTSGSGYATATVETIAYNDTALPNSRTSSVLRDFGGTTWLTGVDTYDGLGRVLRHRVNGPPITDTTYSYDEGGQLRTITSPDPRNDAATISTVYTRDGQGRVTNVARPDGSAQQVAYQGLTVQLQEAAPGTPPVLGSMTRLENDPFGRLVAVHEPEGTDGSTDHVTAYAYDAADRMTAIMDADFNLTTMGYDMAGRRKTVLRGARIWSYEYDADGNMRFMYAPISSGGTVNDFRSETSYDELDRPRVHTPATRGMSSTTLSSLGIGPTSTTYDTAANGVGAPGRVDLPFGSIDYQYNVRNLLKRETRTLTLGHGISGTVTQYIDRTYNALGAPIDTTFDNGVSWTTSYDTRGMVSGVVWHSPGGDKTIASYSRSLAGAPRYRTSTYGPRRDWTYDALGRVMTDKVSKTSGPTWVDRTYGYDGFGRLGAIVGTVNGHDAGADFDFDARDRLATANVSTTYSASMLYTPSGNVRHATVTGALDAPDRDVEYHYGTFDPQAVDRLDAPNGSAWATLSYDAQGNLLGRTIPGNVETITPDGDNQIRQVSGTNGTETYYFGPGAERIAAFGPGTIKLWFAESETQYSTFTGAETKRWHHIAAGEPLARIERLPGGSPTAELQYADALQNLTLTLATDTSNSVTSSFIYGGFGEVVWQTGSSNHRRQFNGKESDSTSGLRHYGFRSYDPVLLRWTSSDPLFRFVPDAAYTEPQRANLYAFSLNNPLRYYDPDGRNNEDAKNGDVGQEKHEESVPCGVEGYGDCPKVIKVGSEFADTVSTVVKAVNSAPISVSGAVRFVLTMPSDQGSWQQESTASGPSELNHPPGLSGLDALGGAPEAQAPDEFQGPTLEANWDGLQNYNDGGAMTAMQHVMERHGPNATTTAGHFAPGTTEDVVRSYVSTALAPGSGARTVSEGGRFEINYRFPAGTVIGTHRDGSPANALRIYIRDGHVRTAFPVRLP